MYITTIQIDPENPVTAISFPHKYSGDLAKDIGLYYTLGMPEETDPFIDGKISEKMFLEQVNQIEEERDKMFWKEFENFEKIDRGIYAFVYDSSDRLQHVFWEQKILEEDPIKINKVVEEYWIKKDKFIGEVLKKLDKNTLLLIVSDHGFTSFERAVSLNTWLVNNGFMVLTKEIGNEEGALFKYVDWDKTKAYALGFNSIYVNLKGREPKGIVEDKEKVIQEIISKLEGLKDGGKKVVNKAYKTSELHSGEYVNNGPDIIVGYNPGYRTSWQTAVGGFTKEVLADNEKIWDGDHLVDPKFVPGILFSNAKFNVESASQMDVAPTILDAIGIEVPEAIDGKSLLRS
jgi:predicted AlkP superfamily phosphohydrolase/phosphomutase